MFCCLNDHVPASHATACKDNVLITTGNQMASVSLVKVVRSVRSTDKTSCIDCQHMYGYEVGHANVNNDCTDCTMILHR